MASIKARLEQRQISPYLGGVNCTKRFKLGDPHIVSRHIEGDRGKIEIAIPVHALRATGAGTIASDSCYGAPEGGWQEGQEANSHFTFAVERWDSGWRLGEMLPS